MDSTDGRFLYKSVTLDSIQLEPNLVLFVMYTVLDSVTFHYNFIEEV